QRACCLPGSAAHLEYRRMPVHAGDGDEVREQLVGVRRSDAVVELGDLVEDPAEVASISACHAMILPHCPPSAGRGRGVPASPWRADDARLRRLPCRGWTPARSVGSITT